jgi:hypothetical protein
MDEDDTGRLLPVKPLGRTKRRLMHSALEIEAGEPASVAYQHTVLCQTCLPYRDPGEAVRLWKRRQGQVSLLIEAGRAVHPETDDWIELGLPYGPKPRLILAYLNREALRRNSPEVEVGDSLTAFVRRILAGDREVRCDPNGREIRLFKDQLARLSASIVRLGIVWDQERSSTVSLPLVERLDLWLPKDAESGAFSRRVPWPASVRLSPTYFESLQHHAVPLDERAIGALAHSAMGLDVYCWLAQRLHRVLVGRPQLVSWKALKDQFGWQYDRMRKFREVFREALGQVLGQYRGARIELDERGMILWHSPPPVLCRRSLVIAGSKGLA